MVGGAVPAVASSGTSPRAAGAVGSSVVPYSNSNLSAVAAQQLAVTTGAEVVVDDLTTPTELTTALPDGTMQYEAASVPVRVKQNDAWVPVDLDLALNDAWFEPEASAMPVRFSAGGSDTLAQVFTEGEWVSEVWPHGDLPSPVIDGDTATYGEVFPDVDLKLVATRTGMASIYVVKSERAAMSAGLADLHVRIDGAQIEETASGTAVAETENGAQLHSGQPLWWDSSGGGTFREPGVEAPTIPVTHSVETDRVSMDVGDSVERHETTSDAEVTYPIFVDPDWSSGISASWYTDAAYPNQSYLSAGASDVLRVGIYGSYRSDMFFQFPLSAVAGKVVTSARLNTTQVAVAASGAQAIAVHTYGPKTAGFTWNQEQAWNAAGTGGWGGTLDQKTPGTWGGPAVAVGWNVTNGVKAKLGASKIQFAFTYASPTAPSRRHYSRAATLIVSYNSLPSTPTSPTMTSPPRACGTVSAPAAVGSSSVTARVNQTDPDPGNVGTNFYLVVAGAGSTVIQTKSTGLGAKGAKSATFTGLSDGVTYAWRARGKDATHSSTSYSAWCYFKVDLTKPAAPTVTAPPGATFTVGDGVDLSVAGASDVAGYVYWVTPEQQMSPAPAVPVDGTVKTTTALPACNGVVSTTVRWACASGATPAILTVAPTDSLSTLWVSAYDKAGNQSAAAGFPLYANGNTGTPALSANLDDGHAWQVTSMGSPLPLTVPDSNPWIGAGAISLNIPSSSWASATDLVDPPLAYPVIEAGATPNPADEIWTDSAPVDASESFTWSMWLKPSSTPQTDFPQYVAVQSGLGVAEISLRIAKNGPVDPQAPYDTPAEYQFCIVGTPSAADNGRPVSNCAAGGTVNVGTWQMLTGVWDADNQQLRLLVGNEIEPVASIGHVLGSGVWSAQGPMRFAPAPDSFRYYGYIANPIAVPGVIDHNQLAQLNGFMLPFSE